MRDLHKQHLVAKMGDNTLYLAKCLVLSKNSGGAVASVDIMMLTKSVKLDKIACIFHVSGV